MVFNIQRYSTHDGEGIRTVIFYKGCTLRCKWCSNPESQSFLPEIMFNSRLCKKFGDCINASHGSITTDNKNLYIHRDSLKQPEFLRNVCLSRAITIAGEKKSLPELIHEVEKDILFYRQSNGGITLSGGEPLAQDHELIEFLKELKAMNIRVSVETSLHVEWKEVFRSLGYINSYLVDLKHIDKFKFNKYTGGNVDLVLTNLEKLARSAENIIIRIPVIPGFNHTTGEIHSIIDYVTTMPEIREVHFIPYHKLGLEKYQMLGRKYNFPDHNPVEPHELNDYIEYAHLKGLKTAIGG